MSKVAVILFMFEIVMLLFATGFCFYVIFDFGRTALDFLIVIFRTNDYDYDYSYDPVSVIDKIF